MNKVSLECWDSEGTEGEIVLDYDQEAESIGIIVKTVDAEQRIGLSKKDLQRAIKQLEVE